MIFGITGNIERKEIIEAVRRLLETWEKNSISFVVDSRFAVTLKEKSRSVKIEDLGVKSDIILTFGGDGTLLYIAKKISNSQTPVLGINTGHLGFLTEIKPEELPEKIKDLLEKKYRIEKRVMIEAVVDGDESQKLYAINDVFIDKGGYARSLRIGLTIENQYCNTYTSNGIIISTATGSTAYSLSAGGPILYPSVDNLLITPICPHTLSARPMIVPGNFSINLEIFAGPDEIPLNVDGHLGVTLKPGQKVTITKSDLTLNLVHFLSHNFFSVLSDKLGWGSRNENNFQNI